MEAYVLGRACCSKADVMRIQSVVFTYCPEHGFKMLDANTLITPSLKATTMPDSKLLFK